MFRRPVKAILALLVVLALGSCGDQSVFLSAKSGSEDLQIVSASDGQLFVSGNTIPLMVSAPDSGSHDVEVETTLTGPDGTVISHNRAAAVVNEQNPVSLPPGLTSGLYRLDVVLYSSGQVAQRKSISVFVAPVGWKITGIRSFPPVITSAATVMLKAELEVPANTDPWLRWTWKGKVIQKGLLSAGLGEILWDVPGEGGVYTVTVELFPIPPAVGSDFSFASSLSLSTDIIVSGSNAQSTGELGPASSYLTLLHLQGSLADAGAGARKAGKSKALAVGGPTVVSVENGLGYQLDGSSGISIPWLALPVSGGTLGPFTVSMGVSFDDPSQPGRIMSASSRDGSFSLVLAMNASTSSPQAQISTSGSAPAVIPWGGPPLPSRQRRLLSLSVVPSSGGVIAQWYLDGVKVSRTELPGSIGNVNPDGSIVIGGDQGFRGTVDEFGVCAYNGAGQPSADPDLYVRAQSRQYGNRLVFAADFDVGALPETFSVGGGGRLAGGSVDLPPGSALMLPPIHAGSALTVTVTLASASGRNAAVVLSWPGSSQPPTVIPVAVTGSEIRFQVSADGRSLTVDSSSAAAATVPPVGPIGSGLMLQISDPKDATADLLVASVLAVKSGP